MISNAAASHVQRSEYESPILATSEADIHCRISSEGAPILPGSEKETSPVPFAEETETSSESLPLKVEDSSSVPAPPSLFAVSVSCPASVPASRPATALATTGPTVQDQTPVDVDVDVDSPGVARAKAMSAIMTGRDTAVLFMYILLVSWAYSFDGTVRCTYQNYATGSFHQHAQLATVNVLRSVVATVAQPTAGKLANVMGRQELIAAAVVFYTIGTLIQAMAPNMVVFSSGAVIYQIGYTLIVLLVEVLVGDSSSTRDRVWVSYIPALPFAVNTWVSGYLSDWVIKALGWRWGIGMWAILFPLSCVPLVLFLWKLEKRAKKAGLLAGLDGKNAWSWSLVEQMDIPGVLLIAATFCSLLVPLTLAGGESPNWLSANIMVPLVLSVPSFVALLYWEAKMARFPLVPLDALKNRSVWAPLILALLLNLAWYMQGDYLYTSLIVCFDFSAPAAVTIASIYSFVGTVVGFGNGILIRYVRRLKFSIISGAVLMGVAFGLMTKFRGSPNATGKFGIILCECILGFAGALYPYPTQAALQARLAHEHQSSMLGVYLAMYQIGSAAGNAISGMIWTQSLTKLLMAHMNGDRSLADAAFQDPIGTSAKYSVKSPQRQAIIAAVSTVQQKLCVVGGYLCIPIFITALLIQDVVLTDDQNVADGDEKATRPVDDADAV